MSKEFFPPRPESRPTIYAYEDANPQYAGLLKVRYTTVDAQSRVAQQYPTQKPGKQPYRIVLEESAMRGDGSVFTDHDVHNMLRMTVKDFELLVSLGVFNSALMNDAVYKFKRYEDPA